MIDKLLAARIDDAIRISMKAPHFVGFLDPAERMDVLDYVRNKSCDYLCYGGYPDADRTFIGFFPDYMEPMEEIFPLQAVTIEYDDRFELSHRDFLGAFMSQGIVRAGLGDILVSSGFAIVFVREELCDYLIDNIFKIGNVGVKITKGISSEVALEKKYLELTEIIASDRIDCAVAVFSGFSRDKASQAVKSGLVRLNYRECVSVSDRISEGDIISIRGKGKFIIDNLEGRTKKGRVVLKARKYI